MITQEELAKRIRARGAYGVDRIREAMREENTGDPADRIEAIASRARDAEAIAAARRARPRLRGEGDNL
jgi:hypothetical protein